MINTIVIALIGATAFAIWRGLLRFGHRCNNDKVFAEKMRWVLVVILLACVVKSLL
ncbi:hypothetical protein YTCETSXE_CDS0076 [Staphylococcus phage MVC_VPHSA2]|uniref:Uncharacterized protein n=1 Tax=Staphylococcus phage MVC_VPHSA1 TaxID=3088876 RepID=A0ABZ0QYN7_9CAUD|nr:hypothetical protein FBHYGVHD_CDS0050 [Staphylococcus phage MVC_VPHSA1]WPF65032.1 hypothetical protein YTCETSXE_CDS0076 [Staphylococcus phage MVC_VPHSA2]